MQRSTWVASPLCLVLLSQTYCQARASPIPRHFHPLKDSLSGSLTVIFCLALSLTILFIFKKIYVARRRKIDSVSIFSDEFSAQSSSRKGGKSMIKAVAKKSGFYVGFLGSPGWETKHSVFVGGGPRHISFLPKSPSPSSSTTILHKVPLTQCEISSTRPALSNHVLGNKLRSLNLSPELSLPPSAMIASKHRSPCFDTKPLLRTGLSSPLIAQDDQHRDFQSNENITIDSGSRKMVSGLKSLQSRTGHLKVSSFPNLKDERCLSSTYNSSVADIAPPSQTFQNSMQHTRLRTDLLENGIQQSIIKPLYFGLIPKKHAHTMSGNSQQMYSEDASDLVASQDFLAVSPWKASDKILDSPKFRRLSVDLSSNSIRLKPRCSTPTKRTRNSPIIGPSPLRTMSLPLDYGLEHARQFNDDSCIQSEARFKQSIEFPPPSGHSTSPKRSKVTFQADDPDIIFDLIRELAEETSAWDASLFVDKNFKALMDQSKIHPSYKFKIQAAQERRSKQRQKRLTACFIPLEDIPESDGAKQFVKP